MTRVTTATIRRRLLALGSSVTVRFSSWDTVEIVRFAGLRTRRHHLDVPGRVKLDTPRLRVEVPDPAALDTLAASGVLTGGIRSLELRVGSMPTHLRAGLAAPRTHRDTVTMTWRVAREGGLEVRLAWRKRRNVARALAEISAWVSRPRRMVQTGGPIHASPSPWPHAVLDAQPGPEGMGPFQRLEPFDGVTVRTNAANPHGRRLIGEAAALELHPVRHDRLSLRSTDGEEVLAFTGDGPVEGVVLGSAWPKFAVVTTDDAPDSPFADLVRATLESCGVVFGEFGESGQSGESAPTGLDAYRTSVESARRATIAFDPVVRRTALNDRADVPLPTISVLVASKRESDVLTCLEYLARQTYPAYEILVGTHGYEIADEKLAELRARTDAPLRTFPIDAAATLGQVLGSLSRKADGELLSKVDDDDHYGPDHLTDLFLAHRTSGADLVAKGARFVHLAEDDLTIDRAWAAVEAYDVTVAGGTLLLPRTVLDSCGGWSESPKHVDADLLTRIRSIGGTTYRTHSLEYVYVRRGSGHTWQADRDDLENKGDQVYDGLPAAILGGDQCR